MKPSRNGHLRAARHATHPVFARRGRSRGLTMSPRSTILETCQPRVGTAWAGWLDRLRQDKVLHGLFDLGNESRDPGEIQFGSSLRVTLRPANRVRRPQEGSATTFWEPCGVQAPNQSPSLEATGIGQGEGNQRTAAACRAAEPTARATGEPQRP